VSFFTAFACEPMEGTMKGRLLLTSALFVFVQIPAQAQVTVDVSKMTCEEYLKDEFTFSQDVVAWLSGYYNGKRNNTIIQPAVVKNNKEKVNSYCYQNRETTIMDAVKNVLGLDR
jgi:acid stress chaperone HdeB